MRRSNFVGFSPRDILGFFPNSSKEGCFKKRGRPSQQSKDLSRLCLLISFRPPHSRSTTILLNELFRCNTGFSMERLDAVHKSSRADDDDEGLYSLDNIKGFLIINLSRIEKEAKRGV